MNASDLRIEVEQILSHALENIALRPWLYGLIVLAGASFLGASSTLVTFQSLPPGADSALTYAVSYATGVALNLIITRTALQTRIGEARRVKLRLFASVAIYVCISVGIMIGMILFVVPGLILSACWSIAIPVAMVENRSPLAALERSAKLTVGNRWPIFGLQLSLVVSVFVWQWLVSKLLAGMLFDFWPLMAVNIMISLVSVALGLVFAVVWAEIFITLSRQRDRVEELDEIFA